MDYTWHPVSELPEHDGWIWISTGLRPEGGSAIKSHYFKKENENMHGKIKLKDTLISVNTARYWMWLIPININ